MSDGKIAGAPATHPPDAPTPPVTPPAAAPVVVGAATPSPAQAGAPTAPKVMGVAPPTPRTDRQVSLDLAAARTTPPATPPTDEAAGVSAIAADLREELAAAKVARADLEARAAVAVDRDRVAYLRKMGAQAGLTDDHLLALAPDADPGTSDGREALHAWVEGNGGLFQQRTPSTVDVQKSIAERLPSSNHGVFGEALHQRVIDSIFGSGGGR